PVGVSLHLPLARPGHVLLLRLHALDAAPLAGGDGAGSEVRPPALPRLHPEPGSAPAGRAVQGGADGVRGRGEGALARRVVPACKTRAGRRPTAGPIARGRVTACDRPP